jgi:hypothetical protein
VNATVSGAVPDEVLVEKSAMSAGDKMMAIVLPSEVEVLTAFDTVR